MFYQLSFDDRVLELSPDWDQTARNQDGAGAETATVRGLTLWNFVDGYETRAYLNALFFTCRRTLRPVSVTYRCDTPTEPRLFRMDITALGGGALQVEHHFVPKLTQMVHSVVVLDEMRPSAQCSQCLSVQIAHQWVDQIYILRNDTFPVQFVICPDCRSHALTAVGAVNEVVQLNQRRG